MKPLISVLMPVYNGEAYLAEAIDSVLAQTLRDWELVIVNNVSRDRTAEIAADYARRDRRIRICTNTEFVDVTGNHNNAFRQMSPDSRYCKVIHADDRLFPECLEHMVAVAEAHPSVGLVSAYRLRGRWVTLDGLPFPSSVVPGRTIARLGLLGGPYLFGSPSSVLFRASEVRRRDPFFALPSIHADEAACYEILTSADFGFVHQVLTVTRMHDDSVTASFAARLNSYIGGNLLILEKYGPVFLTPEEHERRLAERLREYDRFLAHSLLGRPGPKFWDHHRRVRAEAGHPIRWRTLTRVLCADLIVAGLSPGIALSRLAAAVNRSRRAPADDTSHVVAQTRRRRAAQAVDQERSTPPLRAELGR
jgi:glycosyltransferase involved in cell wall biosynthesis